MSNVKHEKVSMNVTDKEPNKLLMKTSSGSFVPTPDKGYMYMKVPHEKSKSPLSVKLIRDDIEGIKRMMRSYKNYSKLSYRVRESYSDGKVFYDSFVYLSKILQKENGIIPYEVVVKGGVQTIWCMVL